VYFCVDNQMRVTVRPFPQNGNGDAKLTFRCCETRECVDWKLNSLLDELKSMYPTPSSKDSLVECSLACSDRHRDSYDFYSVDEVLKDVMRKGIWRISFVNSIVIWRTTAFT